MLPPGPERVCKSFDIRVWISSCFLGSDRPPLVLKRRSDSSSSAIIHFLPCSSGSFWGWRFTIIIELRACVLVLLKDWRFTSAKLQRFTTDATKIPRPLHLWYCARCIVVPAEECVTLVRTRIDEDTSAFFLCRWQIDDHTQNYQVHLVKNLPLSINTVYRYAVLCITSWKPHGWRVHTCPCGEL